MKTLILTCGLILPQFALADQIWSEKPSDAPPLVNLPNLSPIIDKLDQTVVNIQGTSSGKVEEKNKKRERNQEGPVDPFSNPEDFFERFFGQPFKGQQQPRKTLGSGFIISKDGYILTNNHVIDGTDKIEVKLLSHNGKSDKKAKPFQATLVGRDPATDVALLKIKADFDLPFAYLGDSKKIQKGDWVLAFGNPFGLDHSVSAGIVSATGREISSNENRRFDDFIQTDAAINFGNSGGPLVNIKGEVIGINTAITAQGSGIGFAVPMQVVKELIPQLKDSGGVSRGYLGVMIQDVTEEMKEALDLPAAGGVLVNDLVPDGPAAKSDLKRGDIITKVNGQEVADAKELQKNIARVKPGGSIALEIIREKKTKNIKVKLGSLPSGTSKNEKRAPEEEKADQLGITVGANKDGDGVQILDIDDASPTAESGLLPGDIVRKVNGKEIKNIDQYRKAVKELKSKQTVLFDIERGSAKLFIAFRVP